MVCVASDDTTPTDLHRDATHGVRCAGVKKWSQGPWRPVHRLNASTFAPLIDQRTNAWIHCDAAHIDIDLQTATTDASDVNPALVRVCRM